ncbi:MAG: SGNH/GDSL hydrolase family protein [Caulobacteraceae bacterium]|nr:SGNH/GDSL hydrolase family protein [Caulobacter sp.]
MTASMLRSTAGFLLGLALLVVPALAFVARHADGREPPARHDFFPPPHLASDGRYRIVAFGSSSTRGFGASRPGAAYPARLQAIFDAAAPRAGITVVNRGVDGDYSDGMVARIDDDILPRRPSLVVWQLGSNDALFSIDPAHFEANLRTGLARLRAAGTAVLLVGPQWNPGSGAPFEAMNAVVRAVSRETGVPFLDRSALMRRWIGSGALRAEDIIGPDGLHPSDQGYGLIARAVFEAAVLQVPGLRARLAAPGASG